MTRIEWRPWLLVAAFSLVLFLITASTYSSLGVVLPNMVREEHWNWTEAGLGFTLLGAATGASSFVPAFLIRKLGVRATLALGTAVMTAGFGCLAITHGPLIYFLGTTFCGIGYQMMALIPGTHVLAAAFKHRGLPFGLYFTSASAGGVAGPVMALSAMHVFHDQWRQLWMTQAALMVVTGALCILLVGSPAWLAKRAAQTDQAVADEVAKPKSARIYRTAVDWTARQAVRTPQFYVLLAAYFGHLFVGITISSFSVAHLTQSGVSLQLAGVMLGVESLVGTAGRAIGGALGDLIDPRWLLLFALLVLSIGSLSLSVAHSYVTLIVYAVGSGLGFGVTALAVTLLLLNYYGRKNNLEIFSLTCLIGAVSALGPVIAGFIRDGAGGFQIAFQLCAVVTGLIFLAATFMRPPRLLPSMETPAEAADQFVKHPA
ncbi:MAG TPA: MFS transporter [Caulobacteraceae bacterium]|nr:MFS transporter [Caulobacteraceae bacterium]